MVAWYLPKILSIQTPKTTILMKPWYQSPFQGILMPCKHPKLKNGSTAHLAPKRRRESQVEKRGILMPWQTSTQMGSLACGMYY
jgi:hypothetical protein